MAMDWAAHRTHYFVKGDKEVEAVQNYSYESIDESIIAPYLTPIWAKMAQYFPLWVNPNQITVMGLQCMFIGYAILYYYCGSNGPCNPPSWVFATIAILLFIYETMDALDGQQGRRVGMYTNATTELFDHGCDSITTLMSVLIFSHAGALFESPTLAFLFAIGAFTIFISHTWELTTTHVMQFRLAGNPTEGLFVSMAFLIATSFVGTQYWQQEICQLFPNWMVQCDSFSETSIMGTILHCQLNAATVFMILLSAISTAVKVCINLVSFIRQKKQSPFIMVKEVLPYLFLVFIGWLWIHNGLVFKSNPRMTIFAIGLQWLQIVQYLIIAEVTRAPFQWTTAVLAELPMVIPVLMASFVTGWALWMETAFLYLFVAYSAFMFMRTGYYFSSEMCAVLDMPHWWSIPLKEQEKLKKKK